MAKEIRQQSKIGIFLVDNDALMLMGLKAYLTIRFGRLLRISTFSSGAEAAALVDERTDLVILKNYLSGENGSTIRSSILQKNPHTQVVRMGTKREIGDVVEIYNNGINRENYAPKSERRWIQPVYKWVTYPAQVISKEFNVSEFLGILIVSFLFVGLLAALAIVFII